MPVNGNAGEDSRQGRGHVAPATGLASGAAAQHAAPGRCPAAMPLRYDCRLCIRLLCKMCVSCSAFSLSSQLLPGPRRAPRPRHGRPCAPPPPGWGDAGSCRAALARTLTSTCTMRRRSAIARGRKARAFAPGCREFLDSKIGRHDEFPTARRHHFCEADPDA